VGVKVDICVELSHNFLKHFERLFSLIVPNMVEIVWSGMKKTEFEWWLVGYKPNSPENYTYHCCFAGGSSGEVLSRNIPNWFTIK
jgi:hypothetical protein